MKEGQKFRFKIAVIGDSQVGKTTLMDKFTKSSISRDYGKSIGVKVSTYEREIEGNMIRLLFWDIAGSDEYLFFHPQIFKETRAVLIVFSLEDNKLGKESYNHILKWYREVLKNCGEIPIYIIANKVDLVDENKLDVSKIKKLVAEYNFRGYCLASSISGSNIIKIFKEICEGLYKKNNVLYPEF